MALVSPPVSIFIFDPKKVIRYRLLMCFRMSVQIEIFQVQALFDINNVHIFFVKAMAAAISPYSPSAYPDSWPVLHLSVGDVKGNFALTHFTTKVFEKTFIRESDPVQLQLDRGYGSSTVDWINTSSNNSSRNCIFLCYYLLLCVVTGHVIRHFFGHF